MTSEKLKPTPGPWRYRLGDEWSQCVVTDDGEYPDGRPKSWTVASLNSRRDEKEDNARLIAEAGTVFHECGLSPRELLEAVREKDARINELVDALRGITEMCEFHGDFSNGVTDPTGTIDEGNVRACEFIHAARAALAKHKEV
ncbi:hypothetical protein [Comamonas koreensis]|uniref:hypothetical protein n=1 Tax=Comamonas koreensis TaxID=160825 RepID=UPI0015FE7F0F|nr:hypothetical protein [Comamonas koreensis]